MTGTTTLLLILTALMPGPAAEDHDARREAGLLVMAHGGDGEWNRQVEAAIAPLAEQFPLALALGMAQREPLQEAIDELQGRGVKRIAVVRLFISGESFLHQTEYLFGLRPDPPPLYLAHAPSAHGPLAHGDMRMLPGRQAPPPLRIEARVELSREGLYDSDQMGAVMAGRVSDLSREPARESVLILAHGEGDDDLDGRWLQRLQALSRQVRSVGDFRAVEVATLREDWSEKRQQAEGRIRSFVREAARNGGSPLVVPFRLYGFGPYAEVLEGLEYRSDGRGLLPHLAVTEWIRRQAAACLERLGKR